MLTIVAVCFSAIATVVIAAYTIINYKLTQAIQKRDEEYKQQTSDLYQALIISTAIAGIYPITNSDINTRIRTFKDYFSQYYTGKTQIFTGGQR